MSRTLESLPLVLGLLAATAFAQVPDGWFVTSHAMNSALPGPGGLWLHHPRGSVPSLPVTGLPAQLIGPVGSGSVQILPDGRLLVGQVRGNSPLYAWVLTLNGSTVVNAQQLLLGNNPNSGRMDESALLGPTEAVVVAPFITSGPLAGQPLGRISWAGAGSVQPIPMVPVPAGVPNAVAAANDFVYVGFLDASTTPTTSRVYKVPLVGGSPSLFATFEGSVVNMEFDRAGNLVVQLGGFGLRVLNPVSGRLLCASPHVGTGTGNAFAFEPATGKLAIARNAPHDVELMDPCPSLGVQTVATAPANGWGGLTGIDVAPDRLHYGTPSGPVSAPWQLVPFAHGLPLVGNTQFALHVVAPAAPGAWFLSGGEAAITLGNLMIWIDPNSAVLMGSIPASGWIPLPLPNQPAFRDIPVFAQCFFVTPAGIVGSDGLRFSLL